ncbi:hypothetical protein Tco_0237387 [Tanacetum coccineum]
MGGRLPLPKHHPLMKIRGLFIGNGREASLPYFPNLSILVPRLWHEDTQLYGAILPKELTNEDIRNSESYKEYYAIASGEVPPKTKASVHKKKADSDTTPKDKPPTDPKDKRVKQTGTDEGAGDKPEVPDVPEHHSNSEEESWTFSDGDDDDENDDANKDSDAHDDDDDDATESDDDGDNITHPKLSTFSTDDQEENNDEKEQEEDDEDEEEISDQVKDGEEDKEGDVTNVNLEGGDVDMTEADTTKDTEDAHVTLTMLSSLVYSKFIVSDLLKFQTSQEKSSRRKSRIPSTHLIQHAENYQGIKSKLKLKDQVPDVEKLWILMDKMEENKSIDRSDVQKNLYNALVEAYNTDKDLVSSYGDVLIIPTTRDDKDKDEEPSAGSNRGTKRWRPGKEAESSKEPTRDDDVIPAREVQDERQWHPPTSPTPDREWHLTKTLMATPIDFSTFMINRLKIDHLTQELLTGPTYDLIKRTPYPHNLSKPLPLIPNARGRLVIPFDHFINNDLEYLKGGSSSQKYTTSITKTKAADYGQDDVLYKFREGDFKRLRRQDIEDMLLLIIQGKLTNLSLDDRYALNVALRMYTRRIVIQERVEDLQLAVKSYQKKINLTTPDTTRPDLRKITPYTGYPDVQGIIYQDELSRNRLMRTDELHNKKKGGD